MRHILPSVAFAALLLANCTSPGTAVSATSDVQDRGASLYGRHCAVCHGDDGDGETAVAMFLLPRPNAFRDGLFKLVSTQNGIPTEHDLVATLRRGMPGSTMMSWGWLPEADLRALARQVMRLAIAGRAASMARAAAIAGRPLTPAQAEAAAERQLQPGNAIDVAMPEAADPEAGERLYRLHCASCHGVDGRGLPATREWPTDGTWLQPRDFTAGYLRGDRSARDLALRIRAGMPAAHMPPTNLSADETGALVTYLQGLIPATAAEHHTQWRRTLRAARRARLPDDDAAARELDTIRLPLAPLWWRPDAASEVLLRVAHDGEQVLMQLEWADGSQDERARPSAAIGDGAAIQFAGSMDPTLFAMGTASEPVNAWRWRAFDPRETAGWTDLLNGVHRNLDADVALQSAPRSESIQLGGVASTGGAVGNGLPLAVQTRWRQGRWTATFRRSLGARGPEELDLRGGRTVLFAIAIWNGSIDQSAASKSITTWHALELQR